MAEVDVCDYVDVFDPARGFMAFRAGLLRVSTNALTDACQRRKGQDCIVGLKLRDQLVDLLWESCLAASVKVVKVRQTPTATEEPSPKRQKRSDAANDEDVDVEIAQPTMTAVRDDEEIEDLLADLSEEVERLKSSNEKLAASHEKLIKRYDEMVQVVQRLQCQQGVSDRLLCALYDRQRAVPELQLLRPE